MECYVPPVVPKGRILKAHLAHDLDVAVERLFESLNPPVVGSGSALGEYGPSILSDIRSSFRSTSSRPRSGKPGPTSVAKTSLWARGAVVSQKTILIHSRYIKPAAAHGLLASGPRLSRRPHRCVRPRDVRWRGPTLGQRRTTSATCSAGAFSGWIQGRFSRRRPPAGQARTRRSAGTFLCRSRPSRRGTVYARAWEIADSSSLSEGGLFSIWWRLLGHGLCLL